MKKVLLSVLSAGIMFSCEEKKQSFPSQIPKKCETRDNKKVVKHLKEHQEVETDYHYKYDVWNGKFRQQPNTHSTQKYFVVFTDGTHEETNFDTFVTLAEGDTINRQYTVCF